ncbi:MAG: hypothetical protein ACRDTR_17820 [Rubrobacter sp.]
MYAWASGKGDGPLVWPPAATLPALGRGQQAHDQVQPLDLAPRVPLLEVGPGPARVQATMLFGVEQAV